jgi:RNA polymerase sigma factor (sigma-70 family)
MPDANPWVADGAKDRMDNLIDCLRKRVLAGGEPDLTDGQLLGDYLSRRDEAAVAALVRRHGPMVWGVCRRVLQNHHDAEDAFQATFLVLARKAASILPREMVGNWLYGVAQQTALKARATRAKRQARERQVKEMPEPAALPEPDRWPNLEHLLDQELSRLPDKYRVVLVLCDLGDKTRKEAARQLQIPEGTLSSRLTTARMMLAKRLARHGLALSGGTLAAVLSQQAAAACVPPSLVSSTIKVTSLFAAGRAVATGVISAEVAALTEGVLKAMMLTKLKTATVGLLLVAALSSGAGLIYQTRAAEPPKAPAASERVDKDKQAKVQIEPDEAAQPLGRIVRITRQGDKVYINLGKEDNIRPKMALSVYASGSSGANHSPKASLEVLTVLQPHLSLAQVTWLHDSERQPLVEGDRLYPAASNRTPGAGPDKNPKQEQKRPDQRVEIPSRDVGVYNGDKDVQELIHQYRGLSDKDKLGQEGNRIRERILLLSQSDKVALSPFTRDAAAATVAEHLLRGDLQEAKNKQRNDAVKRAVEEVRAAQMQTIAEDAKAQRDQVLQKLREKDEMLQKLERMIRKSRGEDKKEDDPARQRLEELRKRMQIEREFLIQQATKDVQSSIENRMKQLHERLEKEGVDKDNAEAAYLEALEKIERTVREMKKAKQK